MTIPLIKTLVVNRMKVNMYHFHLGTIHRIISIFKLYDSTIVFPYRIVRDNFE